MSPALRHWALRFGFGLAILLLAGTGWPSDWLRSALGSEKRHEVFNVLFGLAGFLITLRATSPLVRVLSDGWRLQRDWGQKSHADFLRATTAQQVFQLLLAVAQADGNRSTKGRDLVLRFLQRRFPDPVSHAELEAWQRQSKATTDLRALARSVSHDLDVGERATLYSWSCQIALATGSFSVREREALQAIAKGLRLDDDHARILFLFAHQMHQQAQPGGSQRGHTGEPPQTPSMARGTRARALGVLDLPGDASKEQIRKRHRQLVRRFHPDAQPHLGPIAQEEATQRFREIQKAYETLTG